MAVLHRGKILNHGELDVKAKAVSTDFEAESHGSVIRSQVKNAVEKVNQAFMSYFLTME